ncbi:putative membrane protein [Pedobacter sp. UYEF25]
MSEHGDLKKEFQVERMVLFTDAVFAIAITLLVIEIRAPIILPYSSFSQTAEQLLELVPRFMGFIMSFFVIAIYWRSHHRLFSFLKSYDDKIIWLNFFFLFFIVLMPFSSSYYSENASFQLPYYFYSINVSMIGLLNYFMLSFIIKNRGRISEGLDHIKTRRLARCRTLIVPVIFFFGFMLDLIMQPLGSIHYLSRWSPILIWPAIVLLNRHFGKVDDLEFHEKPIVKRKR